MDNDRDGLPREAQHVAHLLDEGNVRDAQHRLREDMFQMQNDPRSQRELLHMVDRMDRKGMGADLQIQYGPDGREQWNITPPAYGQQRPYEGYNQPQPQPYYPNEQPQPYYRQPDVVVVPQRPDPGDQILNGIGLGVGIGVGGAIIRGVLGGGRDHDRYRR